MLIAQPELGSCGGTGRVTCVGDEFASALEFSSQTRRHEEGFFRVVIPVSPKLFGICDAIKSCHMLWEADDLMGRFDLYLFGLPDGNTEIKITVGRYGEDYWDMAMHSLFMHHINLDIGSQKRAGHKPVKSAAKNVGRDVGGKDIGWLGPTRQRCLGLPVEVPSDNPRHSAHTGHSALDFFVNLRVEFVTVWVGHVMRVNIEEVDGFLPGPLHTALEQAMSRRQNRAGYYDMFGN